MLFISIELKEKLIEERTTEADEDHHPPLQPLSCSSHKQENEVWITDDQMNATHYHWKKDGSSG